MKQMSTRRYAGFIAGASVFALTLAACSSSGDSEGTTDPGGTNAGSGSGNDITLTVATFNNFGYTDELLQEYMDANPGIIVQHNIAALSDDARMNLTTRLAAGGDGLADIEGIEIDWMPELEVVQDKFVNLENDSVSGRWLGWKDTQGRTSDGTLIGYGTDIGPEAICYRGDLLEAAGLPSDRESVAELIGGENATWESYFAAGEQFVANSDAAWFDSAAALWQGVVGQIEEPFENAADGTPKDLESNTAIKDAYDMILAASETLSGGFEQWTDDWNSAFQNDGFATMLCPPWMTGSIESAAGGVEGWDIADVFPGGGGNWGGSFLTVPATGKNVEEAQKLADWLTAPEQQTKAFVNAGAFPSQVDAIDSAEVKAATNPFFNDAPVGEIFGSRAVALDSLTQPFKGSNYFSINEVISNALIRVDVSNTDDAATSWDKALNDFRDLGL